MKINIYKAKPGMILEKSVYKHNQVYPVLNSGSILYENDLIKLKKIGIKELCVKTKNSIEENSTLELYDKIMFAISQEDYDQIIKLSKEMVTKILTNPYPVINLNSYFGVNQDDFIHDFNICLMSTFIGCMYNKNQTYQSDMLKLDHLMLVSLLQGIGKKCEDVQILSQLKPMTLNQTLFPLNIDKFFWRYDEKAYNLYSYSILSSESNIPSVVKNSIMYLGERVDGKGLLKVPKTIMNDSERKEITMAKIVRIANQYDYLLNYIVTNGLNVNNIPIIFTQAISQNGLSKELVEMFLDFIPLYAVGTRVKLSTDELAIVEQINIRNIDKPVVRIENSNEVVDLYKNREISIVKIEQLEIINDLEVRNNLTK